ncbi:DHH family phosphoesterase [Dehalobacterium formicoaceticum]|uniref:DHH family phosphoesterase n=1 Tax=Dehalobacterium formicoaceticum TaxID=51515 RepID=UPI000B7DCF62|nr:DHH family phosphoesterase [Dehalobacterium formicoaceticum]
MDSPYFWLGLVLGLALGLGVLVIWWHLQKMKGGAPKNSAASMAIDDGYPDYLCRIFADIVEDVSLGVAIVDPKGEILWSNKGLHQLLKRDEVKGNLAELLPGLPINIHNLLNSKKSMQLSFKGTVLKVDSKQIDQPQGFVLKFEDITEKLSLCQHRQEDKPVLVLMQVDNLAETLQEIEEEERLVLQSTVDKILTEWALKLEGFLKKYGEGRYLVVMSQESLRECQKNRFDIMDRIREIKLGNTIPVTLSMGVGVGEEPIIDISRLANQGLELALGRGGDQAVVKWTDKVLFYGGKSNVTEKKTKVRARVVANTLRFYIQQASNVIVMGHESTDLDSAGASLGIAKVAMDFGKPVQLVLDNSTGTLDKLWVMIKEDPLYGERLVTGEEALARANSETLLVICDTNKPSLLVEEGLISQVGRIAIIDHHRRGEEFISEAQLIYVEPYASSTSELVTEIIQYLGEEVTLDPLAASAMLGGIMVDSKYFIFQTGVRTFEAAGFLRRMGAGSKVVRKLLQDDFDVVVERSRVVQNAKIVFENIVLGFLEQEVPHSTIIAAEAADSLLSIEDMKASFVLYKVPEGVNISARSNGEINVQVLLEGLGGGGHLTGAGAQLKDTGLPEAEEKLMVLLEAYMEENQVESSGQ